MDYKDFKALRKLLYKVDDACNFIVDEIIAINAQIATMTRNKEPQYKIDNLMEEAKFIWNYCYAINGRCKYLRQNDLPLLIALDKLCHLQSPDKNGKPIFAAKRHIIFPKKTFGPPAPLPQQPIGPVTPKPTVTPPPQEPVTVEKPETPKVPKKRTYKKKVKTL